VPTSEGELTERQRDVLRLVREGKNPTEIGKELEISSQGVQRNELDRREEQIDAEIARLQDEKRAIGAARKELHKLIPAGSEAP
jgi:FixJ family two-component response regulator